MTSNPCFRSATGPSTCSLVGSSLEPAAGSTSPSASTRPREPFCLSFEGSGVIWALSGTWGLHCCTCAYTFAPYVTFVILFGAPWRHLGTLGAPLGHPWGTLGAPLGLQFGSPGVILASLGHHLCNLLSLLAVDRKRIKKGTKKNRIWKPSGSYFDDISSFCRKWQTAFGLRLRGRIGVGASCFHSLGIPLCKHEK